MPTWPEDHPGRVCGQCGIRVYPIWIDDTPPPGTCPAGASAGRLCPRVISRLDLARFLLEQGNKPMHPENVALMQRVGLTDADLDAERAFRARVDAAQRELGDFIDDGRRPAWLTPLQAWIDADPEVRTLAILDLLLLRIDWCDGERSLLEIGDCCEVFTRRVEALLDEMASRDYAGE